MDHNHRARNLLIAAETQLEELDDIAGTTDFAELSSVATAHAVLALIDIITGDRETEIEQLQYQLEARRAQLADRDKRVQELLDQLDGCREALRQRENAEANAAKTNNDLRKSYE